MSWRYETFLKRIWNSSEMPNLTDNVITTLCSIYQFSRVDCVREERVGATLEWLQLFVLQTALSISRTLKFAVHWPIVEPYVDNILCSQQKKRHISVLRKNINKPYSHVHLKHMYDKNDNIYFVSIGKNTLSQVRWMPSTAQLSKLFCSFYST